jgi:hypothetical protein
MYPEHIYEIEIQLQTCIDNFEDDLTKFWIERLDADDWSQLTELRRDAKEIASALRKRALSLQNIGDVSTLNAIYQVQQAEVNAAQERFQKFANELRPKLKSDEARDLLDAIGPLIMQPAQPDEATDRPLHLVWQHLCIEDARDAADGLRDRVRRIFQLEELVEQLRRDSSLPQATMEFLALIGRTFVWGFDAECVIVCRGAIDTAFREKVPVALIETRRHKAEHQDYGLQDRIEAACPTLINEEIRKSAEVVKCRGDKAIHFDPHATQDALGTIRLALKVIDRLAELPNASS